MKNILIISIVLSSLVFAKIPTFQRGVRSYDARATGARGLNVQAGPINATIKEFKKAYKNPSEELEAGIYLMRCYYYKGKFVTKNDEQKKIIFSEGKTLGENLIKKYPNSPGVRYWYLVNLGSWAELYGTLAAAKEGVASIMRDHAKKIIALDPYYGNGGGYFMLGAVHFKSPYIPFLLSWPSNEKALEYLGKAYNTGQKRPSQAVYFARALYKNGKKEDAKALLNLLLKQPYSESEPVEDFEQHEIARELLTTWE